MLDRILKPGSLLAALLLASCAGTGSSSEAKQAAAKHDLRSISQAIQAFILNNNEAPDSLEQLVTPDANGARYLASTRVPLDPWGRPYLYEAPGDRMNARVGTLGRDGVEGGEGLDEDLYQ